MLTFVSSSSNLLMCFSSFHTRPHFLHFSWYVVGRVLLYEEYESQSFLLLYVFMFIFVWFSISHLAFLAVSTLLQDKNCIAK